MAEDGRYQKVAAFFSLTAPGAGTAPTNFTELSGLDAECEAVEHREALGRTGLNNIRKVPGTWKYSDVTIKRAVDTNGALYDWVVAAQTGTTDAQDVTIMMHDNTGAPIKTYVLKAAWPKKYTPAALNAKENSVAIEEIVLAHEGFSVQR